MIFVTKRDGSSEYTEFSITNADDVANLPTYVTEKNTNVGTIKCVPGSVAKTDGGVWYELKTNLSVGTNGWVKDEG